MYNHNLIHFIDKVGHEIDKGNYTCGIFVDFPKTFDTVDCHILLKRTSIRWCQRTLKPIVCFVS